MPGRLKGKVAIVTGGGTGIGEGIAVVFAREGGAVVVCGRTMVTLEEVVESIKSDGGEAYAVQRDVSKADQVEKMVKETVNRYGKLDILVNKLAFEARYPPYSILTRRRGAILSMWTQKDPGFAPSMRFLR